MLFRQATTASHSRISQPYRPLPDSEATQVLKMSRQSCKKASAKTGRKTKAGLKIGVTHHTYCQLQHQKDEGMAQWCPPLRQQRQQKEAVHARLQERRQRQRLQLRQIISVIQRKRKQTYLYATLAHRTCSSACSRLCVPDELLVLLPREEARDKLPKGRNKRQSSFCSCSGV